jgi:hypothetical protein
MTRILALLLILLGIIVTPHKASASSGTCSSPCSATYVIPGTSFNVGGSWSWMQNCCPYEGDVYYGSVRTSPVYSCPTSYGCYLAGSGVRVASFNPSGNPGSYQFWANWYACADPSCTYKGWYYPRLNAGPGDWSGFSG